MDLTKKKKRTYYLRYFSQRNLKEKAKSFKEQKIMGSKMD